MEMNQPKDNEIQINVREIFFALLSKMGVILLSGVLLAVLAVNRYKAVYDTSIPVSDKNVCII